MKFLLFAREEDRPMIRGYSLALPEVSHQGHIIVQQVAMLSMNSTILNR